jgi:hypothetical protein
MQQWQQPLPLNGNLLPSGVLAPIFVGGPGSVAVGQGCNKNSDIGAGQIWRDLEYSIVKLEWRS